jgi:hypothetical protein
LQNLQHTIEKRGAYGLVVSFGRGSTVPTETSPTISSSA